MWLEHSLNYCWIKLRDVGRVSGSTAPSHPLRFAGAREGQHFCGARVRVNFFAGACAGKNFAGAPALFNTCIFAGAGARVIFLVARAGGFDPLTRTTSLVMK